MIDRLKAAGVYGLAIVLFIVALPLSVISFAITTQLMLLFLGIGLMLAFVGYIVLLPATVAASLTGNEDNPKFVFGAAAVVAVLLIAGMAWFSLDQRAKSAAIGARLIDEVQAGERILCDHPDASGSRPTYFPADWLFDTVQVHGWTCWAGGDDVYHPRNEEPFLDRFEFPYEYGRRMTQPESRPRHEVPAAAVVRLFYDPAYAMAETDFDTTRKAEWVADSLAEQPIVGVEMAAPRSLTPGEIATVHTPEYVEAVRTGEPPALAGSNGIGWDPALFDAVAASNGGAVAAAMWALEYGGAAGSLSSGLHHAKAGRGDGFCTFNGLALAARRVLAAGAARILVLDLDAHCGGGTHELLADDPHVWGLDVAVDAFDRYRPAARWTLDLVTHAAAYLPTIERRLDELAGERFDLVLYNAGMDPFEACHVGGLPGIDHETLAARERLVFERARAAAWPIAFVLAGGYATSPEGRRRLVDLHRETITAAADR